MSSDIKLSLTVLFGGYKKFSGIYVYNFSFSVVLGFFRTTASFISAVRNDSFYKERIKWEKSLFMFSVF